MFNFHEILFKIGKILDVVVINDGIKYQLYCQIKDLINRQLENLLSIKEENLVNKIVSDYNNLKKSNFSDFNNFKYSTYNNIDNFLKGNTFNELIHTIYAKIREGGVKDIKKELKEPFDELVSLSAAEDSAAEDSAAEDSAAEENMNIDSELANMLIWKYGRFVYLKFDKEVDFINDARNLIEQYFARRSNGILSHMFDAAE